MAHPSRRRKILERLALSSIIGVALGWMLVRGGLPVLPSAQAFATVRPWAAPVYFATLMVVHLLRAARWRHLLRPLGEVAVRTVLWAGWLGFAAVLLMPLRTGEVVRPYLLSRRSPVAGWQAAGSVVAERIIDGAVLSAVLLGAMVLTTPLQPLPTHLGAIPLPVAALPAAAYAACLLFAMALALMVLLYWRRALADRLVRGSLAWASPRLADQAGEVTARVASGMVFLPSARRLVPFLLETGCYWAANAAGLWLLALGCGLPAIGPLEACVVMGSLGIGILVPSGPGFFGTYQLSVYLALAMYVAEAMVTGPGAALVFIAYCCQLGIHLAGAAGALLIGRRSAGGTAPAEKLAATPPSA